MDDIGITRGLPFADYLALPGANFGTVRALEVSPLHYQHALRTPAEETDAMTLGRVVHAMVLTGALPEDMAAFEGKARRGASWAAFQAEHAGKTIVRKAELVAAKTMREAVMGCAPARALLERGEGELTMRWRSHGLRCRGRLDWLTSEGQIVELKTTRAIDPRVFARECATRLYHAQLAFYSAGLAAVTGREAPVLPALIAVENAPPYDVAVYRVGYDAIEAGQRKVAAWLERLRTCMAAQRWPGVAFDAPLDLRLPEWATADGSPDVDLSGLEADNG